MQVRWSVPVRTEDLGRRHSLASSAFRVRRVVDPMLDPGTIAEPLDDPADLPGERLTGMNVRARNNITFTSRDVGPVVLPAHGFGCDQNMCPADHR
jgi:hypothetical protein